MPAVTLEWAPTKDRYHVIVEDRIKIFIGTVMRLSSERWMWWFDGVYLPMNRTIWPRLWTKTRRQAITQLVMGVHRQARENY